jgi:hypothetical protein
MKAIRLRRHIDSETLSLPEIKPLIGRNVEIIILEEEILKPAGRRRKKFSDSAGMYPDFDEEAVWRLRRASKI